MDKITREINLELSGLHIREAAEGEEQSRMIEGHAVVYGVRSVNLTPWSSIRDVYEVMEPGSISQELLDRSDVVLTAFHNNQKIMGRCTKGKGTLRMELDGKGLKISCELARTQTGDEMLELIRRGDVSGMSFAYTTNEEDSENCVSYERLEDKNGREQWLRHVKQVTGLYDVTIAGHPAYQDTDIEAREVGEAIEAKLSHSVEEVKEREAEAETEKQSAMAKRERELQTIHRQMELNNNNY